MDFSYFWTDSAFEICRSTNEVIRLFRLRDGMGHVASDTDDTRFSP